VAIQEVLALAAHAGVVALSCKPIRPDLARCEHILVRTAGKQSGGCGLDHQRGGLQVTINTVRLVDASAGWPWPRPWTNVQPEIFRRFRDSTVTVAIPDNNPVAFPVPSAFDELSIEHVEIQFNATHPRRGQLRVVLTSLGNAVGPGGIYGTWGPTTTDLSSVHHGQSNRRNLDPDGFDWRRACRH